jgi:hypothetical protein
MGSRQGWQCYQHYMGSARAKAILLPSYKLGDYVHRRTDTNKGFPPNWLIDPFFDPNAVI